MGLLDFFRQKEEMPLVFSGDNLEADLVIGLLKSAGFHPYELSNIPRAALGALGAGRVLVPPEELEEARAYLEEVTKNAGEDSADWDVGEPEDADAGENEDRRGEDVGEDGRS